MTEKERIYGLARTLRCKVGSDAAGRYCILGKRGKIYATADGFTVKNSKHATWRISFKFLADEQECANLRALLGIHVIKQVAPAVSAMLNKGGFKRTESTAPAARQDDDND